MDSNAKGVPEATPEQSFYSLVQRFENAVFSSACDEYRDASDKAVNRRYDAMQEARRNLVNSYDALQAQNKLLREALRELVESIESSPKVSIGGIENVYQSQFFVKSISLAKARQALKGEE